MRNVVLVGLGVGSVRNTVGASRSGAAKGGDETKFPFDGCRLIFDTEPPPSSVGWGGLVRQIL